MKKYFNALTTKFGLFFLIIFMALLINNDYMDSKIRKCIVLDKLVSQGSYKRSGEFYLILKEEKGLVFDLIVSPSTFSQSHIGDRIYFRLRDFDIRQTYFNNLIYFILPAVIGPLSILLLLFGLIDLKLK